VFNRIHVADIAGALMAGIAAPQSGVFNLCDDEPAPASDVVAHAAGLLGREPPPLVPLAEAGLSPMALSFYAANRRCRNDRVKRELGLSLRYPSYRDGLAALLAAGEGLTPPA
jgi:nucleoside-diphosphate-sugar epimerase